MIMEFDLEKYLRKTLESNVQAAIKASLKNVKQSLFMAGFARSVRAAEKRRAENAKNGLHVPTFLIASITQSCNLRCAGCYARAIAPRTDEKVSEQLTDREWAKIFDEAKELGISFIILAGGEPILRRGVIEAAGERQDIMFPIITNGTLIDGTYIKLFKKCRNLIPIISIEGGAAATDNRRGSGVYERIQTTLDELKRNRIISGASVTVTTENITEVCSREFIDALNDAGCRVVIMIEYAAAEQGTDALAPTDKEREYMDKRLSELKKEYSDMLFVSFPGDERAAGGCLAAGRGFFHINASGGAEPCPFSPVSAVNVKDTSLEAVLRSDLFRRLDESGMLTEEHHGGCVLLGRDEEVKKLM